MTLENTQTKIYNRLEDYVPENMESLILELVQNGIKAVDLISKLTAAKYEKILIRFSVTEGILKYTSYEVYVLRYAFVDPPQLIAQMLAKHKIRELEYILPSMEDRIKFMYFPMGTKFKCEDDLV